MLESGGVIPVFWRQRRDHEDDAIAPYTRWSISRVLDESLPGIVTAGIVAIVALLVSLQGDSKSTQMAIQGLQETISQLRGEMQRKSEQWDQRWLSHDERLRELERRIR